jgi:hypothetical protein
LEKLDFGTTRLPSSAKIEGNKIYGLQIIASFSDLPKKHRARSIRNILLSSDNSIQNVVQDNNNSTNGQLPFLEMTPKNAQALKEIHRENVRRKRFVDGNRQLEMKIYCEK